MARVPLPAGGIQSNTCRNAPCSNFGVEPMAVVSRGWAKKGQKRVSDGYRVVGHNKLPGQRRLRCMCCGEHTSLKNNLGIKDELDRISRYLKPRPEPCCQNEECTNYRRPVSKQPRGYHVHGLKCGILPRARTGPEPKKADIRG